MTTKQILRKLESTRKAYSKLWDRLEDLETDLDEAEQQDPPIVLDLTGWGVSEMRDGLGFAIGNLDDAIKEAKKKRAGEIKKAMKKFRRKSAV